MFPPDPPPVTPAAPPAPAAPAAPSPVAGAAANPLVPNPLVPIPLSPEDLTFWRDEIQRARKFRVDTISQWDVKGNLERYTPKSVKTLEGALDAKVRVAKDLPDVERKKAALFYDTPAIALIPDPGTDGSVLPLHQELLNALLSDKRMDAKATVLPTIQDCLVAIQPVPTEIGYTAVSVNVPEQLPAPPDPLTGMAPMNPDGSPVMVPSGNMIPVIVWEDFFWEHGSPASSLIPVSLKNTKYDKAPWAGHDWRKPLSWAKKTYQLTDAFSASDLTDKPCFDPIKEDAEKNGEPMVGGTKLWYRAHLRDPKVTHPEVIRELVLIEGHDQPIVHRNCPYQTIGPDGRLTPDSIIGFPEHPLALRDLTDSAYVAADLTLMGPLTLELNKSRTINVEQRDGSKLHVLYDPAKINPETRDKIEDGNAPKFIPVEPGVLDAGVEKAMAQVPALRQTRESFLIQDIIERDRADVMGLPTSNTNAQAEGGKTATEISTVQRNADARFEQERQRTVAWFLRGVQKVSALVLRYGDRIAVEILGPQRAATWVQARDAGQFSRFSFTIVADSGNYVDIESRKRQTMQLYNMTAKDPSLNRGMVQARLATEFGIDPSQWIVTKPPEQKPEPITSSISVKPEDLDPGLPSYRGTYVILTAQGIKGLPPPTYVDPPVAPNPADHGGMAELTPRLNQHQLSETGEQPGPKVM